LISLPRLRGPAIRLSTFAFVRRERLKVVSVVNGDLLAEPDVTQNGKDRHFLVADIGEVERGVRSATVVNVPDPVSLYGGVDNHDMLRRLLHGVLVDFGWGHILGKLAVSLIVKVGLGRFHLRRSTLSIMRREYLSHVFTKCFTGNESLQGSDANPLPGIFYELD
jgi:hypothetical protein